MPLFAILAAAATTALPPLANDPDVRCAVTISAIIGSRAKTATPVEQAGMSSVMMYFVGKIDAHHPGADYLGAFRALSRDAAFGAQLGSEARRCGAEAKARGEFLQTLGQQLQAP